MPTISAGTTATITLAANQTVSFAPDPGETATYVVTRAGATVGGDRVTGQRTVGPFAEGDSMSITADRGAVDYTLGTYLVTLLQVLEANGGGLVALSEVSPYVNLTATGTAFTGPCELAGFDCTAVTSSPTITIYDNTSAAGTVIVPTTTLTVGRTEFAYKRALTTGCHVVLSGTQTVNILVG